MKISAWFGVAAGLLATHAAADVHSRSYFVFVQGTGAFANAYVDYDDATGAVSAWADYAALPTALVSVDLEGTSGSLLSLTHPGGTAGFAFGTGALDAAGAQDFFAGATELVFRTAGNPSGEIVVSAFFGSLFTHESTLTAGQVTGAPPSLGVGTSFLTVDVAGDAQLSGFASGLTGQVTDVEVRGPAYFGVDGPLIASGAVLGNNGFSDTFFLDWTPADAQALAELKDGLVYVLVKTDAFPQGEIRGQITASVLGTPYCPPRPNSVQFNGAGLSATGSVLAADNDLTLNGAKLPKGKAVLPVVGISTGHLFNLPGTLCIAGGSFGRISSAIGLASQSGTFSAPIDLATLPFGAVQLGDTLNFQLWYRDVVQGVQTTNLSGAVSIRFH